LLKTPVGRLPHKVCNAIRRSQNLRLDLRYTGESLGPERLPSSHPEAGAYGHVPTDAAALSYIFRQCPITGDDVLVDVGCGKGRVIAWWLNQGFRNRIIGIEIDEKLAAFARQAFGRYENVEMIQGDINDNLPEAGSLFFMFNPFNRAVMEAFKEKLWELAEKRARNPDNESCDIRLIYYYPVHLDVFSEDQNWRVTMIKQPWWERLRLQRMECAVILPAIKEIFTADEADEAGLTADFAD
jgi:SAM-dependent methyltransferase